MIIYDFNMILIWFLDDFWMIFERKTKKRLEMGSVKSDLDETLSELLQFFQILMWYQPYGLKSTNKGVN